MEELIMMHNPNCGTARGILAHLRAQNIEPTIRLYMNEPLDERELRALLAKIAEPRPAHAILRRRESLCADLDLLSDDVSEERLIAAMVQHPVLIQRPILIKGDRAVLARAQDIADVFLDEVME